MKIKTFFYALFCMMFIANVVELNGMKTSKDDTYDLEEGKVKKTSPQKNCLNRLFLALKSTLQTKEDWSQLMASATLFAKQNWNGFMAFVRKYQIPICFSIWAVLLFYLIYSSNEAIPSSLIREELYKCYLDGGCCDMDPEFLE